MAQLGNVAESELRRRMSHPDTSVEDRRDIIDELAFRRDVADLASAEPVTQRVSLVDVKVPFGRMVMLLVQIAFAAIPALLIVVVTCFIALAVLVGLTK